jgi:hypothetical protein
MIPRLKSWVWEPVDDVVPETEWEWLSATVWVGDTA